MPGERMSSEMSTSLASNHDLVAVLVVLCTALVVKDCLRTDTGGCCINERVVAVVVCVVAAGGPKGIVNSSVV